MQGKRNISSDSAASLAAAQSPAAWLLTHIFDAWDDCSPTQLSLQPEPVNLACMVDLLTCAHLLIDQGPLATGESGEPHHALCTHI